MANAAGKSLTHTKVEHAQGPGFTNLNQPIQKVVGYRSEVRGYGLAVGRGESLFWDSCLSSFGGDVLLG